MPKCHFGALETGPVHSQPIIATTNYRELSNNNNSYVTLVGLVK